jgi:DNA-binding SARP family transcriptional activator/Flp pilus assembly protein TadD
VVRIQLLGPVRAWRDGDEVDLGGPRQQAVLALLAAGAAAGHPTSRGTLVDTLWQERPPASAENVIQTYLKRLRRLLEPGRPARAPSRLLPRVASGYTLALSHVDLDLVQFRRLIEEAAGAERAGDRHRGADLLREALRLWHDKPLANLEFLASHPIVAGLSGQRWEAVARYGEAMLATGKAAEAMPALTEAAIAGPLDEGAHARLIRVYHALGNRAQAFVTYHAIRRRLAEELGVKPGQELTLAHDTLLAEDRESDQPRPAAAPPQPVVPAQLPPATTVFTGRREQLRQLDKLLPADGDAVTVVAVVGAAGVGKTSLAVRWARQVADRFPDGQLFVNLRGFDSTGSVMGGGEAVRSFLDALQVPPQQLPTSFEAQVGLFRSLLAGRRMLIVLDNARDAAQVRPLLAGAPGCLVLVTSRDELGGLVTADGAIPLRLDLLGAEEAAGLLARRLGADRVAAEPEALAEIVRRCGGLPLALAIVAGRAATRPEFGLAALVDELREASTGLDLFAGGDPATDLRAVLSWSYRALDPATAKLFRLLAVHPGPEISTLAAAGLARVPAARARSLLANLTRAHLLTEPVPGRFAFHDLLRTYARELVDTVDSNEDRRTATHRMLDHYLHSAHAAATVSDPQRNPIAIDRLVDGVTPQRIESRDDANRWFARERRVLLGCVPLAAGAGFDRHAWQLTWCLAGYLEWHGHWRNLATVAQVALTAAVRLDDRPAQARIHSNLGVTLTWLGRYDEADPHCRQAIQLYEVVGDQLGEARARFNFAWLLTTRGEPEAARSHDQRSLELFRAAGHRTGEARGLNALAWSSALSGEYRRALGDGERALGLLHELGDRFGEGSALHTIGYAHHHLGEHERAVDCYQRALARFREVGDRYHEADTLTLLGDARQALGEPAEARTAWKAALTILRELGHANAERVQSRLAGSGG